MRFNRIHNFYCFINKSMKLYFDSKIEREFQFDFFKKHLSILRLGILISIAFFSLIGIDDIWLAKKTINKIWLIRFGIMDPFFLISLGVTYTKFFRLHMQKIMMIVQLGSGIGAISILAILTNGEAANYYYYAGLMLIIFGNFTLMGLQFINALVVSVCVLVGYECIAIFRQHSLQDRLHGSMYLAFINSNFFLFSCLLIGLVAGYLMERYKRSDFLNRKEIETKTKQLSKANMLLRQLSFKDGLTDVYNRRAFNEKLAEEWLKSQRYGTSLSLVMIDVDNFKKYNDKYGHQQGDECLIKVSQALQECFCGPNDFIARYGGEEFAIILPDTDETNVAKRTDLLHGKMQQLALSHTLSDYYYVTLSVGVTVWNAASATSLEDFLKVADTALYQSKNNGRNCTTIIPI
ncbi:GGDEF domain-containing protein [Fodinisporobacter ferrooxydans]|uniref:GGDEF domain-containing protein n=1 Tax=Fodinisporobacter ferrooxydans TaxID=2901836 RepID=A0ABY4CE22_9BACL|nr:GGDEF domain-containing protein [Alicyclobacillaceae bacterium MYW30-H2]